MTLREAVDLLLTNFSPEEATIPDSVTYPMRTKTAVQACNGALQELYGEGKAWMRKAPKGFALKAPTTVTVAVTADSTTAVITGWATWMEGCSIVINGASVDNEILVHTSNGNVTLLFPYDGTTGSQSALVYCNSLALDDDTAGILSPVKIVNGPKLAPVGSPDQLHLTPTLEEDFGRHKLLPNPPISNARLADIKGTPQLYCVDSPTLDIYEDPTLRLRISPPPDRAMMLSARAVLIVPTFSIEDLDTDTSPTIPVPLDYAESIFLPIAQQRLMARQFFLDHSGKDEIARAYEEALKLANAIRPQRRSGISMRPLYG